MSDNPVLAEVRRNNIVESCHRGSAIAVNAANEIVYAVGDVERDIYPRSSLKFMQALPLVMSGAADKYNVSQKELSLACASHNAEEFHVDCVREWLQRMDLSCDDLECGPTFPIHELSAHKLSAQHLKPGREHQNCSGKHSGMLTLAKFLGAPTKTYSHYEHPAQQAWLKQLAELCEFDALNAPWERDGCGMPAICMPMRNLALGMARYAAPSSVSDELATAMQRIIDAVTAYPEMLAGTDRCCTAVIKTTKGRVLVKTGAEAVYAGFAAKQGLGFVLKIDDGSNRGSEVALGALLKKLNLLSPEEQQQLQPYFNPDIKNSQHWKTGEVVASSGW